MAALLLAPLIAMVGMVVAIVAHVVVSRAGAGPLRAYARSLLAGAIFTALACSLALSQSAIDGWVVATTVLLFCSWWFIFFLNILQAMESSIRVNLIREILANGGSIPRARLDERYNDGKLIKLRLERLLAGGVITEREGKLFVTSASSRFLARFFKLLKVILIGKESEFSEDIDPPQPWH